MMLFRIAMLGPVLVLLMSVGLPTVHVSAQEANACAGADEYVAAVHELSDRVEQEFNDLELSEDEIETWTASDFANAARLMDKLKSGFEDLTPPAAEQAHEEAIRLYGTFSQMFTSMQTAGLFGALPYTESIEQTTAELRASALEFEQTCNVAYLDHDDDDAPEIGLGSSTTPVSGETTGTRENPIPIGMSADVDDDWEIMVQSVEPDATALVLAE